MENRTDCPDFQVKHYINQCGDCQTDGHYLCKNCRFIAPFEKMELADSRETHYPEMAKMGKRIEELQYENQELRIKLLHKNIEQNGTN